MKTSDKAFTVVKRSNKKVKRMLFSPTEDEEAREEIGEIREYQREIFENCKDKNSIIFLETGTGKTLISILLIDYYFKKFQKAKKVNSPPLSACSFSYLIRLYSLRTKSILLNNKHRK